MAIGLWTCAGCVEPSYVSLGRNVVAVSGEDDAGAPAAFAQPTDSNGSGAGGDDGMARDPCVPVGRDIEVVTECAERDWVECPPPTLGDPDPVSAQLTALLRSCNGWDNVLAARFESGCVTSYDLASPILPEAAACVAERLSTERYFCAESVACAAGRLFSPLAR